MRKLLPLLPMICLLGSCETSKKVGRGAAWTYEKTKSGMVGAGNMITTGVWGAGRMVGSGAKKLWPWKKKETPPNAGSSPAVARQSPPLPPAAAGTKSQNPPPAKPAAPPRVTYLKGTLWATDAAMGNERRHSYENSSIQLEEGWKISGSKLNYIADYADSPPSFLRVEGSPAVATTHSDGRTIVVEASQIHYRKDTGLLALKGWPKARIGINTIQAASSETILILNLNDGSFQVEGPIKTASQ